MKNQKQDENHKLHLYNFQIEQVSPKYFPCIYCNPETLYHSTFCLSDWRGPFLNCWQWRNIISYFTFLKKLQFALVLLLLPTVYTCFLHLYSLVFCRDICLTLSYFLLPYPSSIRSTIIYYQICKHRTSFTPDRTLVARNK